MAPILTIFSGSLKLNLNLWCYIYACFFSEDLALPLICKFIWLVRENAVFSLSYCLYHKYTHVVPEQTQKGRQLRLKF